MTGVFGIASDVSTILAAQDGVFDVSARQGVDLGAMVNPSYLQGNALTIGYKMQADFQSYSAVSALTVVSATGNVSLNTLSAFYLLSVGDPGSTVNDRYILPATVDLTAFTGGITIARGGELYPSATGQLSLIANQAINLSNANGAPQEAMLGLIDASASTLPSPLNPMPLTLNGVTNEFDGNLTSAALINHSQIPLHADDTEPVRIYSLTDDIIDGALDSAGLYNNLLQISVDKPAQIQAGKDIRNLIFQGQNLRDDDITSIIAGQDIRDDTTFGFSNNFVTPSLVLGGSGTFDIEAGRNIGALSGADTGYAGIDAIGNARNPYLPHESANVNVLFGTGKGIDLPAFIAQYIAPGASIPGIDTMPALIAFMEQYDEGKGIETGLVKDKPIVTLDADQAWNQFQALPETVQRLFAEQVLFQVLTAVGRDYNDPSSPFANQYARGYAAISTLFPADLGYTANGLGGGSNGEAVSVPTGNLDMRGTTIQTQQGGNVTILGPGGRALVGSSSAPPAIGNAAGGQGILTLEKGDVNIFTDTSLLLAQSRVFTEQGGDMVIWSSNGDINAGKGAKTVADVPPPLYVSDSDHYNTLDARGEVTGAGIATLQSIPGVPPGSVFLIAPHGTVDAGDAGIRVSGNLFVAALHVANADNIPVQGTTVGVPHDAAVNIGALTNASNAAGAAANAATDAGRQGNHPVQDLPSIITVEVIGYGGGDGTPAQDVPDQRRKRSEQQGGYDPKGMFRVVGNGELTEQEKNSLTQDERQKLARP